MSAKAILVLCLLTASMLAWGGVAKVQQGLASYYANSLNGNLTASGERYDKNAMTAAHRTLAFGTRVKVVNLANGKSVLVTINDRGPAIKKRVIDLSSAAAKQLDMLDAGVVKVSIEVQ